MAGSLPEGFVLDTPAAAPIAPPSGYELDKPSAPQNDNSAAAPHYDTNMVGVGARGAEIGAVPAAGAVTGAGVGGAAMIASGIPEASAAIPVVGPAVAGAEVIGASAYGAYKGGGYGDKLAQAVLDYAPPEVVKALGLDKEQQAADQAAHPNVRFAGELAPNLLAFRPGAIAAAAEAGGKTILQKITSSPTMARAVPATIMGAQEAANEELNGGELDPTKIGIAAGVGALSNKPTTIGAFLHGAGAGPVMGLQAALKNRGKPFDATGMRDITPQGAPPGTPRLEAQIDPEDIAPGDAESPIPTSIIAAGRKIVREATTPVDQAPVNSDILARNGWPQQGTRVTLDDGEGPTTTGTVHAGFNTTVPGEEATADGLHVQLDTGQMFTAFKHEIEAAGINITPDKLVAAGLPADLATQPAAPLPTPADASQAPTAASPPVNQGMPVDLFQPRTAAAPQPTGDGTQAAPIAVSQPEHVEQASDLVNPAPTEAQAEAGNYQKLHLKLHGLDIAIENPKGSVRSGTGPEGPWSVTMPASYGYIKRTEGADGDHVDAYVGPNPQSSKVWVIDQRDAKTGAFDEHKSFIGFSTKQEAIDTYNAAFSDGLGPQRMGGIREMNTLQFKALVNSGTLSHPASRPEEQAAPIKTIQKTARPLPKPNNETSALENIRRLGGIRTLDEQGKPTKEGQDISAVLKDVKRPGLINNKAGLRPDMIRESMKEHGWFGHQGGEDIQDLYDLIRKNVHEGPQFHPGSERGRALAAKLSAEESERAKDAAIEEINHVSRTYKQLFSETDKAAMLDMVQGGLDPESAVAEYVERSAIRENDEGAKENPSNGYEEIPFESGLVETGGPVGPHEQGPEVEPAAPGGRGLARAPPAEAETAPRQADGEEGLKTEPGTAVDGAGKAVPQTIIPGTERGAVQAAAAREAQGHGKIKSAAPQQDAGGMFAPKLEETKDMFSGEKPEDIAPAKSIIGKLFGDKKEPASDGQAVEPAKPGTEQVGIGADLKRMIDLFGPKMYGADMPQVTAKELLQNSFDGIKAALQRGDIKPGEADIDIYFDRDARTLTITDNGAGMSPQIVKDAFLTVAGTDKGDLAEADRSGGFGIAKLAFIFGNDGLKLSTVRDGLKTTLDTNSKELLDGKADLKTSATRDRPGTTVTVTFPKEYLNTKTGEKEPLDLPYDAGTFKALQKPLIGDVAVNVVTRRLGILSRREPLRLGRNQPLENTPKVTTAHFNWGDVDIYLGKPASQYSSYHTVLSSGLYQFDKSITTKPAGWEKLPNDIILNVRPSVGASSPMYPFNNQREDFSPKVKDDITALTQYLQTWHAAKEAGATSGSYADVKAMPITRKLRKADYSSEFKDLGLAKRLPDRGTKFDLAPDIAIQNGKTSIGGKNRDFGKEMAESESLRADKFSFPERTVPTVEPLFHNNLNVDVIAEAAKRSDISPDDARRFLAGAGTIVSDFRAALAKVPRYEQWATFPAGISLDKSYHGVHISVPYKGFFLNPLSVRAKTEGGIARSYIHTLIHEAAHTYEKDHSESFTVELAKLEEAFEDTNPGVKADLEAKVQDLLARDGAAFYAMREVFNDETTKNIGSDAESAQRQALGPTGVGGLSGRALSGRSEGDGQALREGDTGSVREGAGGGDLRGPDEPSFSRVGDEPPDDHQAAIDHAWDGLISASAKKLGWEGEPTSAAMNLKAMLTPKGPARTELYRNARAIKELEDQRDNAGGSRLTPIKGDGETKVRGLAKTLADKAAKAGHAIEDLPTYDVSKQAPIIARAEKFDAIPANRATAEAVAMGAEPAPYGMTSEAMLAVVSKRADREGDWKLAQQLATKSEVLKEATTMGQRISMLQNIDPMSAVAAIKSTQAAREGAAKVKGVDAPKAKKDAVKAMLAEANKRPDATVGEKKIKLNAFIQSVICP